MTVKKFFRSFLKEKRWLEKMNGDGYELMSAAPFTYTFEKTGKQTAYEYVFLKKGRKSYIEFDYKSKDSDAKAVYANGYVALFKKPVKKGEFTLFKSFSDKRTNYMKRRSSLYIGAVAYVAGFAISVLLWQRLDALPLLFVGIAFAVLGINNYLLSMEIDKYINKVKKT